MPYGLFNTPVDDDDSTYDTEDEVCDQIEDYEDYDEDECIDNKYYIGSYFLMKEDNLSNDVLLLAKKIRLNTFYQFNIYDISTYIHICSGFQFKKKPNIDIMKLIMHDQMCGGAIYGLYTVVIKTFWIKIIQRTWKKIMKQKKQYDAKIKRQIFSFSNTYQITSRNHVYIGLKGMLHGV